MISLLLIYYLGKQFYVLAEEFEKNKWLFAILGVVFYYLGILLFSFFLGLWAVFYGNEEIFETSDFLLGLMAMPIGLLTTWLFYFSLKKYWSKTENNFTDVELLDDNI